MLKDEACTLQSGGVVRKALRAEAGQKKECNIQSADNDAAGPAHPAALRNDEVGVDPNPILGEIWQKLPNQLLNFIVRKAVEKEVGNDEVVAAVWRAPDARIGLMPIDPFSGDGITACLREPDHAAAAVYRVDCDPRIGARQASKKTAVSIAENQRALRVLQQG